MDPPESDESTDDDDDDDTAADTALRTMLSRCEERRLNDQSDERSLDPPKSDGDTDDALFW